MFTPETAFAQGVSAVDYPGLECFSIKSGVDVGACVALTGYYLFYIPTSWLLYASATVFDAAMAFTLSTDTLNQPFVADTWGTIRDIANLFFVFVLLYIAIGTILQIGGVQLKKALTTVIIVALVINFSLFFTRVVIDASNIFALEFYNAIGTPSSTPHLNGDSGIQERSIAAGFVGAFDPQKMISPELYSEWKDEKGFSKSALFIVFLLGAIVNVVTAYVLFFAGFLMVGRVVAFLFLAIASPIAFMSYAVPKSSGFAGKWWGHLANQALLAPVFLFFIYVIAKMIEPPSFVDGIFSTNTNFSDILMSIVLNFVVIISALFMALKVAQGLSGSAGAHMMKFAGNPAMKALRAGRKIATRHTIGRAASRLSESEKVRSFGRKMPGVGMAIDTTLNKMGGGAFNKYIKDQEKRKVAYGNKVTMETARDAMRRERMVINQKETLRKQGISDSEIAGMKLDEAAENIAKERVEEKRKQYATSLEHPTKLGKIAQKITGEEIADREAARRIRKKDKGEDPRVEAYKKWLAEEDAKKS